MSKENKESKDNQQNKKKNKPKTDEKENTIVFKGISSSRRDTPDSDDNERTREIRHIGNIRLDSAQDGDDGKAKKKKKRRDDDDTADNTIDMSDIRAQRKRRKVHRRLKKLIAPLVIIALGVCVYLTRGVWAPRLEGILDRHNGTIVNDGVTQTGNFPIKLGQSTANIITVMDNNIIAADDGHIYYYDENGKLRDTVYHNFASPVLRSAGKRLLACDNGGNYVRVYGKNGEIYEKKSDSRIIYGVIAENGYVAAVTQNDKYNSYLTVYDTDGTEMYHWSCGKRIIDVSFSRGGDSCFVTVFSSEGGEIVSEIHQIAFDDTNEIMVSDTLDSLVLKVCENDNGRLWAVGDESIYLLDKNGKKVGSYEYASQLKSFDADEECASVITDGAAHDTLEIAVFDSDDELMSPTVIESDAGEPKKVLCRKDKIFVLSTQTLDCYDRGGSLLATAQVSSDYTDFVYYNESVFFLGRREINKILFNT